MIAEIEGAEVTCIRPGRTDNRRRDGDVDDHCEGVGSAIILEEVIDLLSQRWDRIHGAQALKLLPIETKLHEMLFPLIESFNRLQRLASWVEPSK
ncbi:hypothetical protein AgCh_027723 [Apium graveolens]